jgi:Flp pilus assembly protein TadG
MGRARRPAPRDEGAAAVEFAIVAPLVFLLLFWTFTLGWELWEIQAAQSSAGQVARNASIQVSDPTDFVKQAACLVSRTGVGAGRLTRVTVAFSTDVGGKSPISASSAATDGFVTVTLAYRSTLAGLMKTPLTSDGNYTASAVARLEQIPPSNVLPTFGAAAPEHPCD